MAKASWQRRIQRAKELTSQRPFAAEILGFYVQLARFQEGLYQRLENASQSKTEISTQERVCGPAELRELVSSFGMFLSVVEASGPARLAEMARDLRHRGDEAWSNCLDTCWSGTQPSPAPLRSFWGAHFCSRTPNSYALESPRSGMGTPIHCAPSAIASRVWEFCVR